MSKNERKKAGLHKEISSIFKGVVIPRKEGGTESSITSIPEETHHAVPTGPAIDSQKDEVLKPYQTAQTLHEAEPAQESKAEPIQESRVEPVEQPKAEPIQESEVEPVQELKAEPIEEFKAESVEQSKVEPVEEPKAEPVQQSKVEPVAEPKVEPVEESRAEPVQQSKVEPAHTPKFLTAQESKVIPIEESEVGPIPEAEDKSVSSPKFLTAQESEVEPAKEPENEPANKSELKKPEKPKVIPVQKSKKTGIGKISKKVSEKRSVGKVGNESSWKQITSKLFAAKPGASTAKQKAMVVMVPILFIALLVFVLRGGVFGTSVPNVEAGQQNNVSDAVNTGKSAEIDWEIPEPYPTTLRDPMKLGPVVKSDNQTDSVSLAGLKVRSILCSEDKSSAIVGSSIVHEGDDIGGGVKIIKISKDGVEFEMDGKKWTQSIER